MDVDTITAKVWGPLTTTASGHVTQARVIVRDGRLFVAESQKRGAIITSVTEYPAPEGEPAPNPRKSQGWSWGPWRWESCGCGGHSWRKHPIEALIAQSVPSPALAESLTSAAVADIAAGGEIPTIAAEPGARGTEDDLIADAG